MCNLLPTVAIGFVNSPGLNFLVKKGKLLLATNIGEIVIFFHVTKKTKFISDFPIVEIDFRNAESLAIHKFFQIQRKSYAEIAEISHRCTRVNAGLNSRKAKKKMGLMELCCCIQQISKTW